MESKQITRTAIFAALYIALGIVFQPISFMLIQCRVACALIPLIALFGSPATIGITIGHLIFNFSSPLGSLDYLSPFVFLIPRYLIQRYGVKAMPIHTLVVALYVGWMGHYYLPFLGTTLVWMFAVFSGELVAEWYLGYVLLYREVEKRL